MASAREIQSRMQSIKDTMKITSAMYMISSSKMQKAKSGRYGAVFLCAAECSRAFYEVCSGHKQYFFRKRYPG